MTLNEVFKIHPSKKTLELIYPLKHINTFSFYVVGSYVEVKNLIFSEVFNKYNLLLMVNLFL